MCVPFSAQAERWKDRKGRTVTADYAGFNRAFALQLASEEGKITAIPLENISEESLALARKVGVEDFVETSQKNLPWVVGFLLLSFVISSAALFTVSRMMRSEYTLWTATQTAGFLAVIGGISFIGLCVGLSMSSQLIVGIFATIGLLTPIVVLSKMYHVDFGGGLIYFILYLFLSAAAQVPLYFLLLRFSLYEGLIYDLAGMVVSLYA
jgi:hypothetical protein